MAKSRPKDEGLIAKNRRATFDYAIRDKFEAGLVLVGSEVKSMRAGKVDLSDAYVAIERGEAWLRQMFVAPFEQAAAYPHEPRRVRKLLLHSKEVAELDRALGREGFTAVPLRLYFKEGRVKVEIATGTGKKTHDKRDDIAKKDAERETRAAMRSSKNR